MEKRLCQFCHGQKNFEKCKEIVQPDFTYHSCLHIEEKELFLEIVNGDNEVTHKAKFPIKYCPLCGRKLVVRKNTD